jgi:hypothetical protein
MTKLRAVLSKRKRRTSSWRRPKAILIAKRKSTLRCETHLPSLPTIAELYRDFRDDLNQARHLASERPKAIVMLSILLILSTINYIFLHT